ncbi:MAG TPA: winged helix-turn-helix transcriptional regulator, partial [Pseudoxanthomonas sp.]|nr:winged helix-turn-helix transcriptional regulator [Pseudoxanthomonas sp.]
MKLSPADETLLSLLREDARASTAEIARKLQLSRTTVQSRIERLERMGVIAGYTVLLSDEFERERVRALIMVTVFPK